LKSPDAVRALLQRRFASRHREWLQGSVAESESQDWPLTINLGIPSEREAARDVAAVHAWVVAWREWRGAGRLQWSERRWRNLGSQRLPDRLLLEGPDAVADWAGESLRWRRAAGRYRDLLVRWPVLGGRLLGVARHFDLLADYSDSDYRRLVDMLAWIDAHPNSGLYPRQLPVAGVDSKWIEGRKRLLSDLVAAIHGDGGDSGDGDFFSRCGLKAPPQLLRLRILDPALRARVGGLGDISAPWEQLAALDLPVATVFIVEHLQTGLAFGDLPGAVVIMRLGYDVEVLGRLTWLDRARCFYWGDLDTHGFAILSRARGHRPRLRSLLMDEQTLLAHRALWVEEPQPHRAATLPHLTAAEQALYQAIRSGRWGRAIRLEQERIPWSIAWPVLQSLA
jgi:hypothetical protein